MITITITRQQLIDTAIHYGGKIGRELLRQGFRGTKNYSLTELLDLARDLAKETDYPTVEEYIYAEGASWLKTVEDEKNITLQIVPTKRKSKSPKKEQKIRV